MNRRLFVATVAAGAVGASAGCLSDILNDVSTFEANPARVSEAAAEEAGYEYHGTIERVEEREYAGQSVEVTNYISEYTRPIELPLDAFGGEVDAGVFAVVSTPQVSVADEQFNPVGDMSEAELAEYVQEQYDDLEIGDNIGGRATQDNEIDGLNADIHFETFEGTATLQGETGIDVFVDIAQPDHENDHLVVIAVYPDDRDIPLDEAEAERVDTLVEGLEHGEDVDVDIVEESEDESGENNASDEDGNGGNSSNDGENSSDGGENSSDSDEEGEGDGDGDASNETSDE